MEYFEIYQRREISSICRTRFNTSTGTERFIYYDYSIPSEEHECDTFEDLVIVLTEIIMKHLKLFISFVLVYLVASLSAGISRRLASNCKVFSSIIYSNSNRW